MLKPNLNMYFGIDSVGIYSPLIYKRYTDLLKGLGCVDDSTGWEPVSESTLYSSLKLLGMLNVKYIFSEKPITSSKLELIKNDFILHGWDFEAIDKLNFNIYRNKKYFPRFWLVNDYKIIDNKEERLSFTIMLIAGRTSPAFRLQRPSASWGGSIGIFVSGI